MKLKLRITLIAAILAVTCSNSYGQQVNVTGKVTDAVTNEGVPGVNIMLEGTTIGTVSDVDGNYKVTDIPEDGILIYSFIGYVTEEIPVNGRSTIDIGLSPDIQELSEVVVIGYGTTTEKELTGAVSVVKAEEIKALNPTRVEQALQGQTPGVQISSQSGSPGGDFNIRIRGISTNGENKPLILVDGVRYEELSALNPNSIESVNILKDASASIYGVQAANGVILITTKRGEKGAGTRVSLDAYYGIQETERKLPTLNATEYAILANESFANGGSQPPFTDISSLGEGTDWQDEVFDTAPIQNYNLFINGGSEKTTFGFGGGYFAQDGIVGDDKASFERITGNLNSITQLLDNLKLETVMNFTHSERKTLLENDIGSVLFNALNMAPNLTPFDENGDFTLAEGLGSEVINPLAQIENTFNRTLVNRLNGKVGLKYEFMEGLTAESSLGFNFSSVRDKTFGPEVDFGTGKVFNNVESSVDESQKLFSSLTVDNVIHYDRTIGEEHNLKITLGSSVHKERSEELFGTGFGIPNNSYAFADLSQANEIRQGGANSEQGEFRLLSYFLRAEYNYLNRYLFSIILRRDGTTRFGPDSKIGYFPSVSAGWVLSEEDFLRDIQAIDFLKLRASYGITGNDRIGDFRFLASLNGEGEYVFNGNTLVNGLAIGSLANPDIQWERNKQFDVGLDMDLWRGHVSITADYFIKESEDLLLAVPASGLTGVEAPGSGAPIANAGSIQNKGFEFQVNYKEEVFEGFNVNIGYNFTTLDNETLELNDGVAFIQGGNFGIGQLPPTRWEVGLPIGYFYGLKTDGIFQNQGEVEASAQSGVAQPGDLRYVDIDGNGEIDVNDRTRIGNPIPDYTMGFSLNLNYRNFDLSAFADAQLGHDIIRNYERNLPLTNKSAYFINRWHGEGTSDDFPRVTTGANDNDLFSDFWVEDGSYVRVKNVQLGYTLPEIVSQKIKAERFRIYASVNNLHTFTEYKGYDPNISSGDPLAAGIDIGYYPQPRTYIFGLNVTF